MATTAQYIQHFLRRVGFGARPDEYDAILRNVTSQQQAAAIAVSYASVPDDVDSKIGQPGYVGMTSNGAFSPATNLNDARQRWLFRMLHSNRPLQEKMTLFWHNHFATGANKISDELGENAGARYMAAKASEDPGRVRGQIEFLRDNALGNFRDILLGISQDVAMVAWLDGRTNTRRQPQENFAREIMELFTVGVGNYTEPDVYAGARVFTGWNLRRVGANGDPAQHWEFFYDANQHDTDSKTFSFPIYADGGKTIPARSASNGMQDGIDLINALAGSRMTAYYLSTKMYKFFVNETTGPSGPVLEQLANVYLQSGYSIKALVQEILLLPEFFDDRTIYARYSWPVEFVVRAMKDWGWTGFSLNSTLTPLANMGQILYEPPDVAGWDQGQQWFSSGAMLARINFGSTLATNQRFNLTAAARGVGSTPDRLLSTVLGLSQVPTYDSGVATEMLTYLNANIRWTGSDSQLNTKLAALVHMIIGSPEYQLQ